MYAIKLLKLNICRAVVKLLFQFNFRYILCTVEFRLIGSHLFAIFIIILFNEMSTDGL